MTENFSRFDCLVAVALNDSTTISLLGKRKSDVDCSRDECSNESLSEDDSSHELVSDCSGSGFASPISKKRNSNTNSDDDDGGNEFSVAGMFAFASRKKFVMHWLNFDKLDELTVESQSDSISFEIYQKVMTRTVRQLYPCVTGEEFVLLKRCFRKKQNFFGQPFTWIDLWTLPYQKLWLDIVYQKPSEHQSSFLYRRGCFLSQCIKAMWLLDNATHYLVHVVAVDDDAHYDKLSAGFYVFPICVDEKFFNEKTTSVLMTASVSQRYPWRTGQKGVILLRKYILKSPLSLTYQELKLNITQRRLENKVT